MLCCWCDVTAAGLSWSMMYCRDVPAGVLHDLLKAVVPPTDGKRQREGRRTGDIWHLTARFSKFPSESLANFKGIDSIQKSLFNSLKEASFVRIGTTSRVMNMVGGTREELWKSVRAGDGITFGEICASLQLARIPSSSKARGKGLVPVRLFCRRMDSLKYVSSYESMYVTSRGMEQDLNVLDAVRPLVVGWLESNGHSTSNVDNYSIVCVSGALIEGDCTLRELWNAVRAPDCFLYVVVLVAAT